LRGNRPFVPKRDAYEAVAEDWVVDRLNQHNIPAQRQSPLNIPQNERYRYPKEQFDIIIPYKNLSGFFTVEAKRKKKDYHFSSVSDFPFKTVNVDKKSTYDAKNQKPIGYVIVNAKRTAAIFIPNQPQLWIVDICGGVTMY
jgi:hypothetical protein